MNQAFKFLGSYDIFGKSVPGTALILGVISVLSTSDVLKALDGPTFINVASILVLLLLMGLMFGQGVHTLADNIEKLFHWLGRRVKDLLLFGQTVYGRVQFFLFHATSAPESKDPITQSWWYIKESLRMVIILFTLPYIFIKWAFEDSSWAFEDRKLVAEGMKSLPERVLQSWWNGTVSWLHRRYWGIYDSLVSHRRLFAKSLEWNYQPDSGRWAQKSRGDLYEIFTKQYEQVYGNEIQKNTPDEISNQYPLITGRLSIYEEGEYRHFQSIYSFCRSMWVVFLLLTIAYGLQLYTGILNVGSPLWQELTPDPLVPYVPLITLLILGVFLDAAGTYKRHYVEYLISDFGIIEQMREPNRSEGREISLDDF